MRLPPDWQQAMEEIVCSPGVVMVVGQGDVGKTTFCLSLANAGVERGLRVGVVDADVGQSHIGPPGAIGLGLVERPFSAFNQIPVQALYFVGSPSPAGHIVRMAVGTAKMVARAKGRGLSLIVVDGCGMVRGKFAWRLVRGQLEMVHPERVVLLKRAQGLDPLIQLCRERKDLVCHSLTIPRGIRRKSKARRKRLRQKAWENYLRGARRLKLSLDEVSLEGISPAERERDLSGRIVGLHDQRSECLDLGLVVHLDWHQSRLELLTPLEEGQEVGAVVFGSQKVRVPGV